MDWSEIEGDVAGVYNWAGLDPSTPASIQTLCVACVGEPAKRGRLYGSEEVVRTVNNKSNILVSWSLPPARARWRIAHGLAHCYYERIGYDSEHIEARCDALGAALVAPRSLVFDAWSIFGEDIRSAADWLHTTQSIIVLRYGECVVSGVAGAAVLESSKVIARANWDWPSESEIRKVSGPSVRRIAIDDEPKRVGLLLLDVG